MDAEVDATEIVTQQLQHNFGIHVIRNTLKTVYAMQQILPTFFSSLTLPIFNHALQVDDLTVQIDDYALVFREIYDYSKGDLLNEEENVLQECVELIEDIITIFGQEESIDTARYPFELHKVDDEILLQIMAIALKACSLIIKQVKNPGYNELILTLWRCLRSIFDSCLLLVNTTAFKIIEAATSICDYCLDLPSISLYDQDIEELLDNLLDLMDQRIIPTEILSQLSVTLSLIVERYPNLKLISPSATQDAVRSVVDSLLVRKNKELGYSETRAILNVSCLLLKNYTRAPWLDEVFSAIIDSETERLEIITLKSKLLQEFTKNVSISNSQIEIMDIDQDSLREEQQDLKFVITSKSINKKLIDLAGPIITELISLNAGDEDYHLLIKKLKDISVYTDNIAPSIIYQSYVEKLVQFATKMMTIDPSVTESIAALFNYSIPQFIRHYIQYALPYAVVNTSNNDTLAAIAASLETSAQDICKGNAYRILMVLLVERNDTVKLQGVGKLNKLFGNDKNAFNNLLSANMISLTQKFTLNLGQPELKTQSLKALKDIKRNLAREDMLFPQFMSQQVVGFLTLITKYITQKRNNSVEIDDPFALEALKELMQLLEHEINDHAPHLMTIFQSVNDIPNMQLEALSLWKNFIAVLDNIGLKTYLNGIIHGLLQILPNCNHHGRESVAQVIEDVLIGRSSATSPLYFDMPVLPDFEEIKNAKDHVEASLASMQRNIDATNGLDSQMKTILAKLTEGNDVYILTKLKRLKMFISDHPKYQPPHGLLYSKLLYLVRKYASHKEISRYAAICLGQIGAVNPSLVAVDILDDKVIMMDNFTSLSENRRFICGLITNHIYPAYNATGDEETRVNMRVTIQSLLKCAGFEAVHLMAQKRDAVYESWVALPTTIQEFLMTLLKSTYQYEWKAVAIEYPIFTKVNSFRDWIQQWFCQMASVARNSTAKSIFKACQPVVMSDNVDVAAFLIPYIVLFTIFTSSNDQQQYIAEEMNYVLGTFATSEDASERGKMNYRSLQVIVSVTEYLRQWMNSVKWDDRKRSSEKDRVVRFLRMIPDRTMGIAAFNSKAYPQALMHFESHIKSLEPGTFNDPEILQYLRQIYTHLGDTVDLMALLDIYSTILSHDEEIIRFEAAGKWHEAEVMYKSRVSQTPNELSSYVDYMNCLKRWGSYENELYFANKTIADYPQWANHINVFRIDSAWRLEDWHTLEKAVKVPTQKTPEALIGRILSQFRKNDNLGALYSVEEARTYLIERLTSGSTESYRKSYPTILNLQFLHELEDAQSAWEAPNPVQSIQDLEIKWNDNFKNISSSYQYQHNILELRKAALCDVRPKLHEENQTSNLWLQIAKLSRKNGNLAASFDAIIKAENMGNTNYLGAKAKWYWAAGFHSVAIKLLQPRGNAADMKPNDAMLLAEFYMKGESGLTGKEGRSYLMEALKTTDKLEKANYLCASYYTRYISDLDPTDPTKATQKLKAMFYVMKSFIKCLSHGSKYYYSSMSTLINTWFELVKIVTQLTTSDSELAAEANDCLRKANEAMSNALKTVPPAQFLFFLTRLISHLRTDNDGVANSLMRIILGVFQTYPRSVIWFLEGALESTTPNVAPRVELILQIAEANVSDALIPTVIQQGHLLIDALRTLAGFKTGQTETELNMAGKYELQPLLQLRNLEIYIPTETSLYPILPEVITDRNAAGFFPSDLPCIGSIGERCSIMKSLQKPKKIIIHGTDGKEYGFLVKTNDDLRKDARTMEFNYMINSLLKKNPESRDNELYIRTYAVLPMGSRWGLIQWIDNLEPLKGIVNDLLTDQGKPSVIDISQMINRENLAIDKEKIAYFENKVLPICRPVFHQWFLKRFPEGNQWHSSRTRYTKTLAVMSIVGHMLGLGDRHAENILFDKTNGDCIHVDLNMLFDQGASLNVPECVPFRLTQNLIDAMGPTGYKGTFTRTCEITMNVLLLNKEALLSVFSTLANDNFSENLFQRPKTTQDPTPYMSKLKEKFIIKRGSEANDAVKKLIQEASNKENLAKMFVGWAPFV